MADLLQLLAECQEAGVIVGDAVKAGLLHPGLAIDDRSSAAPDRNGDPLVGLPFGAVEHRQFLPAAVFRAQILGKVGHVGDLGGVDLRIRTEAANDVRTGAGIRHDGGLRTDILKAYEIDPHRNAGCLGELAAVFPPVDLVGVDELRRPQHPQLGALLRLEFQWLDIVDGHVGDRGARADYRYRGRRDGRGGECNRIASADGHVQSSRARSSAVEPSATGDLDSLAAEYSAPMAER